jgi:hypothetical protein
MIQPNGCFVWFAMSIAFWLSYTSSFVPPALSMDANAPTSLDTSTTTSCVPTLLQHIVDDAATDGPQHLFVGAPSVDRGIVYVYWQEARAILLIDPSMLSCDANVELADPPDVSWYRGKARIDLETDVVPTENDIAGSTYLIDRPWAEATVAECMRHAPLVIEARAAEPASE